MNYSRLKEFIGFMSLGYIISKMTCSQDQFYVENQRIKDENVRRHQEIIELQSKPIKYNTLLDLVAFEP